MFTEEIIAHAIAKARAAARSVSAENGGSFTLYIGDPATPAAPALAVEIVPGPNLTATSRSRFIERQVRAALTGKGA